MNKYFLHNITLNQTGTVALDPLKAAEVLRLAKKSLPEYEFELRLKEPKKKSAKDI